MNLDLKYLIVGILCSVYICRKYSSDQKDLLLYLWVMLQLVNLHNSRFLHILKYEY